MTREDGSRFDLAALVADESVVDWDYVESGTPVPQDREFVEQLRVISKIAGMHRSRHDSPKSSPNRDDSTADAPARPPGHAAGDLGRWGDLVLIEEIGQGAFGTVYRAHDPHLDRAVAVKFLRHGTGSSNDQLAARLLHEGQRLADLDHPNVVRVYGAAEIDGRVGLWMEFVRGLTLEQMLTSHGSFSAGEAGLVGYELCGALAAVHRCGLVHRDVKAQNVMREEGGRLVLMDFGSGQKLAEPGTAGGRLVGTPLYLAPEVLHGGEATPRSDIYSLGVLLYHLVTGDYPVRAGTLADLMSAHARGELNPLRDARSQLPEAFVQVVERATDPDPLRRFASAGRMKAALAQVLGSGVKNVTALRLRPPRRKVPRLAQGATGPDHVASVAVLPFTDMSPAKDQECFCDGITEELINALTQIPGLRVAARTSAFQFKGQARDARQIGNALNVATILDGSVRKEGSTLRITVELVGSADGYHLWSQRFDRQLEDVFAVQDEITGSIVGTLRGRLAAGARAIAPSPRSKDLGSYTSYLEGRYHWNKRTEDELKKSVACFEQAIEHDPDFAPAHAALGDAYVTLATYGCMPARDVMPSATRALERALAINANLAEAYTCRGCVRAVYDWSWSDAERDFQRAIELTPAYPTAHHWYAINHLVPLGRFEEATESLGRALELDPLALAVKTSVGMKEYFARRYDEAVRSLSKTIELDPGFGMAHFFLGATYTEQARYAEALEELETAVQLGGPSPEILAGLGYLHGVSGDTARARSVLNKLQRLAHQRYVSPARLAQVHAGLDEPGKALDRLEEAHAERAADLAWLGVRPMFARLRGQPRFDAIVKKMGLSISR